MCNFCMTTFYHHGDHFHALSAVRADTGYLQRFTKVKHERMNCGSSFFTMSPNFLYNIVITVYVYKVTNGN